MNTIGIIYIVIILIITSIIIYIYYVQNNEYQQEMRRIELIEQVRLRKQNALDAIRSLTIPCPIKNDNGTPFNDPRGCYIKSGYTCTWNEDADRCNKA